MRSPSRAAKARRAGWSSPVRSPGRTVLRGRLRLGVDRMTAASWTERRERGSAVLVRLMIWLTSGAGLAGRAGAALSDHRLFLPVLARRAQRFQPVPGSRARTARHPTRNIPPPVHLLLRPARPAVPAVQPAATLSDRYDRPGHRHVGAGAGAGMRTARLPSRQLRGVARLRQAVTRCPSMS